MKTKILFSIITAVILSGCTNSKSNSAAKAVNAFYKNYEGPFEEVNKTLLSRELATLIDKAIKFENQSAAELKAAKSTDKPAMIEGDIFTSLYESYTSFKIVRVKTDGDLATVRVEFTNHREGDIVWTDEVQLIRQNGNWKIDDVRYGLKNVTHPNLKKGLSDFLAPEPVVNES
ncbi:PBP1b-binding outer membrane lipoprotein LpoB [Pedobacter cryoconitis]|uniref:PBP1b-binding outer membrane lipoprotein LpoB n=1 Tax=Pedobacter cryoconitis TaxID=188932 RepID=A0A7W8YWU7_9SPHI|nr:DUF3828 domain-containing protein [Pedobacter cryoconitis]MBB5623010.1 PBP1b-binding outer membrane lipoprotein LpoB [Pedobacter cryoconitis]MBB5644945.1 PBP1b-binding outer membrane lipoprotein LpoB [Pedobacter cryoconitis]